MDIFIKEVTIDDVMEVHRQIPEFFDTPTDKLYGYERFKDRKTLFLIAYMANTAVGYLIAYDRHKDKSFYCWITGVVPEARNKGVLSAMMNYLFKWAYTNGYGMIKVKSRNERREMNAYLIKRGFFFTNIEPRDDVKDHRILLEHAIEEDDYDFEAKV